MDLNKNYTLLMLQIAVAAVFVSLTAVFSFASAQLAEGVTQEQIDAALTDLSEIYGQNVITQEQAKEICHLDQYAADCGEIGIKHDLFPAERIDQVNTILDQIKGQVADQIKSCQNIECLVGVAQSLATKISRENPTLASQIDLTPTIVREKKEIVEIAKSAGLTIDQCIEMDPDTASIELLRGCARLAKDSKVQKYVPSEARAQIDQIAESTERTVQLKQALTGGQYQCGDGTINGCGDFCLNPSTEARAAGASAIPQVCREIAVKFFGPEGARELESAYTKVSGVADYYYKKAQNFVFTTLDGRILTDPAQIGKYMEEQGRTGNVEAVSKGMDFMVSQGFATQADKDFALKMVSKFREKGGVADFDVCSQNPKACRDFISDDFQSSFDVMDQVFEIMRQEIGFDPDLCDQGNFDPSIGQKCMEGGKRALPKIEALAATNPEVQFIVQDIKSHLDRGDQLAQKKEQFRGGTFSGPGGCRDERECFIYCSNPVNGPECIAFGSKEGLSGFTGDQAVQKYQQYDYSLNRSAIEEKNIISGEPSRGPYGDAVYQPGYQPYQPYQSPGPRSDQAPGITGEQGFGPSPECLQAITSGDFVTAKQVCNVSIGGPGQVPYPTNQPICPAAPYVQCPEGQYRESFRNRDGCFVDGPCKPIPTYSPGPYPTYSPGPYPTYSPGPFPTYSPGPGGSSCSKSLISLLGDGCHQMYTDLSGRQIFCDGPMSKSAKEGDSVTTPGCSSGVGGPGPYPTYSPGPYPTGPFPTYSPGPGGSSCSKSLISLLGDGCHQMYTDLSGRQIFCDGPMSKSAKEGDTVATPGCTGGTGGPYPTYSPYPSPGACPTGYHWHGEQGGFCMNDQENYSGACFSADGKTSIKCPSQPTGQCAPPQWWDPAKGYCVGSTSPSPWPSPGTTSCPAGYHYHGDSGGFCMNDREDYAGTCYTVDGKSTTTCPKPTYTPGPSYTPVPSCPSSQWWDYARNACVSSTTTYTPAPSCPSGQWWDYATNTCKSSSTGSCPSGSHSMGGYCMSDADTTKCGPMDSTSVSNFGSCSAYQTTATYTPVPSCPSGQWWDYARSACVSSTATYTPYPSCPSGQWWDYATNVCKSTTSTTYTPYPSYTPYSGYCGDAVCSSSETSSSCPSDCGGGTAITYTPYPSPSAVCGNAICEGAETSATCPVDCGGAVYSPTPYPTTESSPIYSPPPSCPSGQYWDSATSTCKTASLFNHQMALHCVQLGREWNGRYCQPEGFLARAAENTWAALGKLIGF